MTARGLLQRLQNAAGLDRHRVADRIDVQHAVHAAERQHDAGVRRPGRGPAHQAGVATLRHDGDAVLMAKPDHFGDFLGAGRTNDGPGTSNQQSTPVRHERLLAVLVLDQALLAHDRAQRIAHLGRSMGRSGWWARTTGRQSAFRFPWRILVCTAHVTCVGALSTFGPGSSTAMWRSTMETGAGGLSPHSGRMIPAGRTSAAADGASPHRREPPASRSHWQHPSHRRPSRVNRNSSRRYRLHRRLMC